MATSRSRIALSKTRATRARPRIIVGISGASGAALGVRVIELLAATGQCELHLVVTPSGERTLAHEVGEDALPRIGAMVAQHHLISNIGASIASGSCRTAGMIVAPCSIRTHLRAMAAVTEIGAIVAPPVPAFYARPGTLAEAIDHMARRAIGLLDVDLSVSMSEWEG